MIKGHRSPLNLSDFFDIMPGPGQKVNEGFENRLNDNKPSAGGPGKPGPTNAFWSATTLLLSSLYIKVPSSGYNYARFVSFSDRRPVTVVHYHLPAGSIAEGFYPYQGSDG